MHLSRRAILTAGGGLALAACGSEEQTVVPGERVEGRLASAHVARDPHWVLTHPPGAGPGDELPVVVALHGADHTAEVWFDTLGIDDLLASSGHGFAIAAIDGGQRSFWHERTGGDDPSRMLIEEFVPLLERRGLSVAGLIGWSMGGLGALANGQRLDPALPVTAVSPALWPSYRKVELGAFDTEEQYAAEMALVGDRLAGGGVRVDCGTGDPFFRGVRAVVPDAVEQHYAPGDHDAAYWTRVLPDELDWLAARV